MERTLGEIKDKKFIFLKLAVWRTGRCKLDLLDIAKRFCHSTST